MTETTLFPEYIHRPEESQIRDEIAWVQGDGQSRVVLLYGPGGVGKTWVVRELAKSGSSGEAVRWVSPVDVGDAQYWLLSSLERHVINELDPGFFRKYTDYLDRLPTYDPSIGHETIVSHLGRIKEVFAECYRDFVESTRSTVVIVFDTVETIRGMYLLSTLTQWMKKLPSTLFVLVGRPVERAGKRAARSADEGAVDSRDERSVDGRGDEDDPIMRLLMDPYQAFPVRTITLGDFPENVAHDYLASSRIESGLSPDELAKLVRLSRGHPLWLAFTIAYLSERGIPEEAERWSLAEIEREIPYSGLMGARGEDLHEDYKRRLMTPYRDAGFWPEVVRRLAVVRQSIGEPAWQRLMSDQPLPDGVSDLHEAWEELLEHPWIRPQANGTQVTLHDAVAEELAKRIIPVHDQSKAWRRALWRRAVVIYGEQIDATEAAFAAQAASVDDRLREFRERHREAEDLPATAEDRAVVEEVSRLDARKRDLDQLRAARLYYQLLCDHGTGCQAFLDLFQVAGDQNDIIFLDLLAHEMQRFLPGGVSPHTFGDVIGEAIEEFRNWLGKAENAGLHLDIALAMAEHLIRSEQPETAIDLLASMPESRADHMQRYHLGIQRGNAYMRIPHHVRDAQLHFTLALSEAQELTSDDRHKLIAKAQKELGFYYRNAGMWREADEAYRQARDALLAGAPVLESEDDREEMASIQTNWAYVKGLVGSYRYGQNLAESAVTVRHRLDRHLAEGNSWSVCGEVYRYERRFQKAWEAYAEAQRIFDLERNWPWLGLIYQEQAICLVQAADDGIDLLYGQDSLKEAKRLIRQALDICRDQSIRHYPSALNRAGRIFGRDDHALGLTYLADAIDWARRLFDGFFFFASLIEYSELSYQAWRETGQPEYLHQVTSRADEVQEAMEEYEFTDLRGRWLLLQGHLAIHRSLEPGAPSELDAALAHYSEGFALIAQDYVGSSGASAIPSEFRRFRKLFEQLPADVQEHWHAELRRAWRDRYAGEGATTLLLARLEELY